MSMTDEERYRTDPHFKQLVDHMVAMILKYQFTPSEMRLAAIIAATKAEALMIRPLFLESRVKE